MLDAHRRGQVLALSTSGTTHDARTVRRTTRSWWASFDGYDALSRVGAGSRVWVPGPLTGTMNLFAAVHAAVRGATLVESPAHADRACLTPAALDRDLAVLQAGTHVVVAGGALPVRLAERARAAGIGTGAYYGAAELSFVAAGAHEEDLTPFPGVEVEVRDGTIWVRSAYVAEHLPLDDGGWASVGDRGALVGRHLTVHGRPGAVTTGGATVHLADVEHALLVHTAGGLACFGVPHESMGEVLVAAYTSPDDADRLRQAARDELPAPSRPRGWLHLDRLPLTDQQKVDRGALLARWREAHPGRRTGPEV